MRDKLPKGYKEYADRLLDKKTIVAMTTRMAQEDPDGYVEILQGLNDVGQGVVSMYGRDAALSYADMKISGETKALNKQLKAVVAHILDDDKLTPAQKESKIIDLGYKYSGKVQDVVFGENEKRGTSLASQILSGSRGNKTQLMQLQFGNMGMKDALNRDIPYIMADPYITGASPTAYWVSASSGRKGFYDTQAATGQAGYLGKQMTSTTHRTVIEKDDCGTTDTGVPFEATSSKNIGSVLLRPFHSHPAGAVVTDEMTAEAQDGEMMVLRSPLTCQCRDGVCAKCSGISEKGTFPGIGEYVSLNAARAYAEVVTQGGLGQKHIGGVGGKRIVDPEGPDQPTGFRNMERMFVAQKNFPGGAVLAPIDGIVSGIKKAPQGGSYISIGDQQIYAPEARTVSIKPGAKVYAGDLLTNGVPNPQEVTEYKGVGTGRMYFTTKLNDIMNSQGWGVDRRNAEALARSLLNKVRITSPDGYRSYMPGELVDYSVIAADYEPRENSKKETVDKALNKYLETPVLNYTIGTKITPEVAAALKKYDFKDVVVSDTEPPFAAKFLRPMEVTQYDAEWMPRLSGERLKSGLFEAARKGVTDAYDSSSYVDKIVIAPFKP